MIKQAISGFLIIGTISARNFVSVEDIARRVELSPPSSTQTVFKDTEDSEVKSMVEYGLIPHNAGQAYPSRRLTNGEILYIVAKYSDIKYNTNYTYYGEFNLNDFINSSKVLTGIEVKQFYEVEDLEKMLENLKNNVN